MSHNRVILTLDPQVCTLEDLTSEEAMWSAFDQIAAPLNDVLKVNFLMTIIVVNGYPQAVFSPNEHEVRMEVEERIAQASRSPFYKIFAFLAGKTGHGAPEKLREKTASHVREVMLDQLHRQLKEYIREEDPEGMLVVYSRHEDVPSSSHSNLAKPGL